MLINLLITAVESNLLISLQSKVAKLDSGLFYYWSILRSNNTAINLQTSTSSYGSRRFVACDQSSHCVFFSAQIYFFSRVGFLGLIMKNRVKSGFFEVIRSPATPMCSTI